MGMELNSGGQRRRNGPGGRSPVQSSSLGRINSSVLRIGLQGRTGNLG